MTHHADSMRRHHTRRSNPSQARLQPPAHMALLDLLSAFASRATCSSRRLQRQAMQEEVAMRNSCTTSRKACSMRQEPRCRRMLCNMAKNISLRSQGNRRSSISSTDLMSCITCSKRKRKPTRRHKLKLRCSNINNLRMDLCPPSDRSVRPQLPRHWPLNSVSHKRRNTTLQAKVCPLARHLPTWRDHTKCLRNINRLRTLNLHLLHLKHILEPCLIQHSRLLHISKRTVNPRIMLLSITSRSSRLSRSTRLLRGTRTRCEAFLPELEKAICARRPNS